MLEAASAQMEIQLKDLVDQRLTIREQEKKLEEKYKEGCNRTKPIYLRVYELILARWRSCKIYQFKPLV